MNFYVYLLILKNTFPHLPWEWKVGGPLATLFYLIVLWDLSKSVSFALVSVVATYLIGILLGYRKYRKDCR